MTHAPLWTFAGRPTAKVVALFSGLNLFMIFLFSLMFTFPRADGTRTGAFSQPWQVLLHLLVALALYGTILWALRPGRRSRLELALFALVGFLTLLLVTAFMIPFPLLALLPVVARYWLSLKRTLLLAAALILWSGFWALAVNQGNMGAPLTAVLVMGTLSLVFGAYTLLSFEFAVRQASAREELDALYGELDESYQALSRYRDLEVRHAHLAERARISRELHDTLGHHLTAQHFDLHVLLRLLPQDERLAGALQRAVDRNREAMEDVRRAVHALRPETLETLRPSEAVRGLVHLSSGRVTLRVEGEGPEPSGDKALALYRLAQESLTNRAKHAPEGPLDLRLHFKSEGVEFEARNPLPHACPATGVGLGLQGLKERIETLGGRFEAEPQEGLFRVWASLPA